MSFYSITTAAAKGSRKYMEDRMIIEQIRDKRGKLAGLFCAILDGHGGVQASGHVQKVLWSTLSQTEGFTSSNDEDVLDAMRNAFLKIHEEMEKFRDTWPLRPNGYASTAGTTCSCALIRDNKLYTAHCGDSRIILLAEDKDGELQAEDLTRDHKPDDEEEKLRIERDGGRIASFTAVSRVMWTREVNNSKNTAEKRTETIPFLSIARSLGDYWSYVPHTNKFAVSPDPDVSVRPIDLSRDKYLLLVSDGITNVLPSSRIAEQVDEWRMGMVRNMSRYLLKSAIHAWRNLKADNMSIICVGFHDLNNNDSDFNPIYDLNINCCIEDRLTAYPREIILVYPQKLLSANPDWDDLISVQDDESDEEAYIGPGFVTRRGSNNSLERSSYMRTSINTTSSAQIVYSPSNFRKRLTIHSGERPSCLKLKRPSIRLNSPSFVWKSPDTTSSQRIGLRRFDLYFPLSNERRAKSSTPSIENEEKGSTFRQSWPLTRIQPQQETTAFVENDNSTPTARSPSIRRYKIHRMWTPSQSFDSTIDEDFKSEEDVDNEQKMTPKRKHNLEIDEIEAKRQNCRV